MYNNVCSTSFLVDSKCYYGCPSISVPDSLMISLMLLKNPMFAGKKSFTLGRLFDFVSRLHDDWVISYLVISRYISC